ncbi:unnamed protein product [Timema podura]|uniref:3'-5' exonuclease n=1 Tax=Timema podura TaxID=61482 RepID=A0ABN7NF89_TIMPD|nr:unnamed protein product [Timema podura]
MDEIKEKRVLPSWMLKLDSSSVSGNNGNVTVEACGDDSLNLLKFFGRIDYCSSLGECGEACSDMLAMLNDVQEELVLGFDMEWPVNFKAGSCKTALIQVCPKEDLSSMISLPQAFICLLQHPKIIFVGVNISGDFWKLSRDFGILVKPLMEKVIDLGKLANEVLNSNQSWSLDGLVLHLFRKRLLKSEDIRISDWTRTPLSQEQENYAATDAYASLIIYKHLKLLLNKTKQD